MTSAHHREDVAADALHVPWVTRATIALTVALFLVQATVLAPGDVAAGLGFRGADLGHRWWTIATFPLVHVSGWTLLTNVGVLAVFGGRLERAWGSGEYLRYYVVCSLGAWITHVVAAPPDAVLVGSAAPAVGSILAFAALSGRDAALSIGAVAVSAGWLALGGTAAVLLVGTVTDPSGTSFLYLVHGGGLVAGWAYLRTAGSISLARLRDGVSPVPDEIDDGPPRAIPRSHPRAQRQETDDIVARSNAAVAREEATRRDSPPVRTQDPGSLDRVLDKISAQGLESLTSDERRLLDEMSRRLRDDG